MALERARVVRLCTWASVAAFLAVLAWYLQAPGYTHARLALFVALGAFAVVGAAGVHRRRTPLVAVGLGGLLLLGFWQAVLWLYIYPVGIVIAAATLLDTADTTA